MKHKLIILINLIRGIYELYNILKINKNKACKLTSFVAYYIVKERVIMSIAESKEKFNIDENEIIDGIDKSLSCQYPKTLLTNIRRMILSSYGMVSLNLRQRRVNLIEDNLNFNWPIGGTVWKGSAFAQIKPAMVYLYELHLL